jgi:hypothetical protein
MLLTARSIRSLLLVAAVVALVGCGASTATTSVSSPTPVASPTPVSSPTRASASPSVLGDVAGARQAALRLFVADPSVANHWYPCANTDNWAACPLAATVKTRLAELGSKGYFSDAGGCGEEYISGSQNGLNTAPTVLSAVAEGNGSVTVVIQRGSLNNLTATMAKQNGTWLATDLASGTGPAASIFSAKPNC